MPVLPMTELSVCSLQLPLSTSMSFHENYNKTKQNPFKAVFHQLVHALPRSPKVLLLLLGPKKHKSWSEQKRISNMRRTQTAGRGHSTRWEEFIYITFVSSVCVNSMKKEGKRKME